MRSKNVKQNYEIISLTEIHNKENTTISKIALLSSCKCQPCKMADTYTICAAQSGVTNPGAHYSLGFCLLTVLDLKLFSRRLL